jgi:MSHA biogenesis protein MshK
MSTRHVRLLVIVCGLWLGLCHRLIAAEPPLADPTRPPDPVRAVVAGQVASAVPGPTVWPHLQSVRLSTTGGSSAVIDGRIVRVGERVGETTLMAIGPQSIVLRGVGFSQQVALLPGTFKTASTVAPFAQEIVVPATRRH